MLTPIISLSLVMDLRVPKTRFFESNAEPHTLRSFDIYSISEEFRLGFVV
jgi:hypothetical protein